jgi:septal ring factor EnvC (AmiA/AmiB activator)
METNNLTKSFGIRVPLDMYLKMIEVSTENKITLTDICLYSLANSGILKSNFSFKMGGAVNTDQSELISKLRKENDAIRRTLDNTERQYEELKNAVQERVEKEVGSVHKKISNMEIHRDMLQEKLADAEQNLKSSMSENLRLVKKLQLERMKNDTEFRKGN